MNQTDFLNSLNTLQIEKKYFFKWACENGYMKITYGTCIQKTIGASGRGFNEKQQKDVLLALLAYFDMLKEQVQEKL